LVSRRPHHPFWIVRGRINTAEQPWVRTTGQRVERDARHREAAGSVSLTALDVGFVPAPPAAA
jgi:hypothetical protein